MAGHVVTARGAADAGEAPQSRGGGGPQRPPRPRGPRPVPPALRLPPSRSESHRSADHWTTRVITGRGLFKLVLRYGAPDAGFVTAVVTKRSRFTVVHRRRDGHVSSW